MVKMAKNMIANREWKTNSTKNQKVVALTTEVSALKKRLTKTGSNFKTEESNKTPAPKVKTSLARMRNADLWRVTKMNTTTIMHDGKEHTWCPEHKSRDESIAGS